MKLDDMELFVQVVDQGSFTKAAEFCELPKSTVSRRIRDLEQSLKSRLLDRTTRSLHLTEVGEAFYHKVRLILAEVEETEKEIAQKQGDYSGKLTVYAPDSILDLCIDHVTQFCRDYPDISLILHCAPQPQNLMTDKRFDLLLDIGTPADSSFIARPLAKLTFGYFASPEFLEKFGSPKTPDDLNKFDTIAMTAANSNISSWHFNQHELTLAPKCIVDSPSVIRSLAVAGQGICCLPTVLVAADLKSHKLIRLFNGEYEYKLTLYGIYHSRRFVPEKVKLLLDDVETLLQPRVDSIEGGVI
ncbi:LysR family transcriptional regulator [uncultured Shewanella sp.]|uniref:LysR family transcriptional regulator n=1 Tax=uncultured Shewanella sp. TaxID=173975 RepID=UPI002634C534|nr:LysR family transcriptional regulator [uncultured Shewanella sp.]